MLDINYIKENLEKVKKSIQDRKADVDLEKLLSLDTQRRDLIQRVDELRSKKNEAAKNKDIDTGIKINSELDGLEKELKKKEKEWKELMFQVPNVPLDEVPEGDASKFDIIHKGGEVIKFNFSPRDHVELGAMLDIIDLPKGAKVAGARFAYLKNEGVLLELALVQYAINRLIKSNFIPVIPPTLIKKEITDKLGYWHGRVDEEHTANENYYLVSDEEEGISGTKKANPLYLIGTGEHAIVPMHADEIFAEEDLPKKYVAFSPCYRREVGKGGQDVRGILRVHQFDKVEMVAFVKPEDDERIRKEMRGIVEEIMKDLGLPYQVKKLPSEDISFPAAETIDIETWIPSQNIYRETHSISTTTDFQARRLKTRFKEKDGSIKFVHILNGTAIAIGRTIIAILENFQQEDGSVKIPEVLHKYTGFSEIKPK